MRTFSFLLLLMGAVTLTSVGQALNRYTVVPRPAQLDPRADEFVVSRTTTLLVPVAHPELKAIPNSFASRINRSSRLGVTVRNGGQVRPMPGHWYSPTQPLFGWPCSRVPSR